MSKNTGGRQYNFRTLHPLIISMLDEKIKTKEASAYINEALLFYIENRATVNTIKDEIVAIRKILESGVINMSLGSGIQKEAESKQNTEINQLFINSIDEFT